MSLSLFATALATNDASALPVSASIRKHFPTLVTGIKDACVNIVERKEDTYASVILHSTIGLEHAEFLRDLLSVIQLRVDAGVVPSTPQGLYHEGYEMSGGLLCVKSGLLWRHQTLEVEVRHLAVQDISEWLVVAGDYLNLNHAARQERAASISIYRSIATAKYLDEANKNYLGGF